MRYAFDQFELDTDSHRLVNADGEAVVLRPQAFKVLAYLVEQSPSVVSRKELLAGVWGHDALSASGVSQAIREIRRALRDNAAQPRIIATRHGCGYQIVTRVVQAETPPRVPAAARSGRSSVVLASSAIIAILLIGLGAGVYWSRPQTTPSYPFSGIEYEARHRAIPSHPIARASFLAGEHHLREMNWKQAAEYFNHSLEIEPETPTTLFRLIEAYSRAGFDARARALIDHPGLQRSTMTRREQLEFRALAARSTGNWEEAIHCLRSLAEFFPGHLDYHFGLFEALLASRPPGEAAEELRHIDAMQTDGGHDIRYFLALHALNQRLHKPAEALAAARLALDAADAVGQDSLRARAELALGRSLARIENRATAREALRRAASSMNAAHDEAGYAEVLGELAKQDLRDHRIDDARARITQACGISESIGHDVGIADCARGRAAILRKSGPNEEIEQLLLDAAMRYEHAGELQSAGEAHMELTRFRLQSKRIAAAEQSLLQAARLHEHIGDRAGFAWVRHLSGLLLQCKGKPDEALVAHAEARTIFESIELPAGQVASIMGMVRPLADQNQTDRALELLDHAANLEKVPKLDANAAISVSFPNPGNSIQPACTDPPR